MKSMIPLAILLLLTSCLNSGSNETTSPPLNASQKEYWYNNEAEVTSYDLKQARYGEIHSGHAVLIFVTEPFSTEKNTKADNPTDEDISVLKLNFTKKFTTGIYPYSMMTSTFFPFENGEHSFKVSSSSQEWCGHTYMELRNKRLYEVTIDSYFEGESIQNLRLSKDKIEDDVWTIIRLDPEKLPVGSTMMIPSFMYLRLLHQETKAYPCELKRETTNDSLSTYRIHYPDLDRTLSIQYETAFPHCIISWEETYASGWGEKKKKLTTTARRIKTIKTDYWTKNANENSGLRDTLGLK